MGSPFLWAVLVGGLASLGSSACAEPTVILLARSAAPEAQPEPSLDVLTRSTGVRDPLVVRGADVAYADVEASVGYAVVASADGWARARPPTDRFQMTIELTSAEASYAGGRLSVALGARATLRRNPGNVFVAQTSARCDQAALLPASEGQPVFASCARLLGRSLASWLAGVAPDSR